MGLFTHMPPVFMEAIRQATAFRTRMTPDRHAAFEWLWSALAPICGGDEDLARGALLNAYLDHPAEALDDHAGIVSVWSLAAMDIGRVAPPPFLVGAR